MTRIKKQKLNNYKSRCIHIGDKELEYVLYLLEDAVEQETHGSSGYITGGGGMTGLMGGYHYNSCYTIPAKSKYNGIIQKAITELKNLQLKRATDKEESQKIFEDNVTKIDLRLNPPIIP